MFYDVILSPVGQPNFKKEYHNRAERERTRKINSSIQEIRVLTGTGETDKVSILENAVTIVKEINAGTYRPPASVQTGRPVAAPQAMAVAAVGAAAAPAGAAAVGSNAWQTEISPLFDVMHIAAAMVSLDLRITGSNQSMAAVIGCECAELLEQPFLACFHPEDAGHISRTMRHLQQQQHAHTQQVQAQAQLAAQAAAAQATVAQSLDGIATPPLLHVQPHAIAPLQTWEVLTVRVCRRVRTHKRRSLFLPFPRLFSRLFCSVLFCLGPLDGASELSHLARDQQLNWHGVCRPAARLLVPDRRQAGVQAARLLV